MSAIPIFSSASEEIDIRAHDASFNAKELLAQLMSTPRVTAACAFDVSYFFAGC